MNFSKLPKEQRQFLTSALCDTGENVREWPASEPKLVDRRNFDKELILAIYKNVEGNFVIESRYTELVAPVLELIESAIKESEK